MMKKMNHVAYGLLLLVAIVSVPLLIVASILIPPRYLWVPLEVAGGILVVCIVVYCAVLKPAGLKVSHPESADAVRVANQLIKILFFDPESYINMPDHSQFIDGLYWLAYPGGIGIMRPVAFPDAADMVGVAKQLLKILSFDPESYINMPNHSQFIKGLYWLAYPEGIGIKRAIVNPKIDPVSLKVAHPDAADAVCVANQLIKILFFDPESYINMPDHSQFIEGLYWLAYPGGLDIMRPVALPDADMVGVAKQLIEILFFHPESYINMPNHSQFIKGLYWLAYPEGIGIKRLVVNPKIDPIEGPKIELDAIVVEVVNPRIRPVEVVEVAEDGNLRIQYV